MAGSKTELSKSTFNDEVLEEIEAVKQIYEGQVTSDLVNDHLMTITLSGGNILMVFNING